MQPQNQTIGRLLAAKARTFVGATCLVVGASFALGASAQQPAHLVLGDMVLAKGIESDA